MEIFFTLLIFTVLVGPALGSFFAAVVMRQENMTKATGRVSVDDITGDRLKWFELIPIFSFLYLRGKSRYSDKPLDVRILLSELMGLFIFSVMAYGAFVAYSSISLSNFEFISVYIIFFLFTVGLFFLSVYDLFTYSIPSQFTLYITLSAIVVNIVIGLLKFVPFTSSFVEFLPFGNPDNLLSAVMAGGVIWGLIKLTKQKGMGEGDIYIAIIMGLMLGGEGLLAAFYVTVFSAVAVGLLLMIRHKQLKGLIVPLVPFMNLGFVVGAFFGKTIVDLLFFSAPLL